MGDTSKLCQNICLENICWSQKKRKKLAFKLESFKKLIFGRSIWGFTSSWYPQAMSKYLALKYLRISKKYRSRAVQKIDFCWVHLGRFPGGGSIWEGSRERGTPSYVKMFVSRISTEIKKSLPQLEPFKKSDFLGHILERFLGKRLKQISGDKIAFVVQQLYPKIRFRCFVV